MVRRKREGVEGRRRGKKKEKERREKREREREGEREISFCCQDVFLSFSSFFLQAPSDYGGEKKQDEKKMAERMALSIVDR